MAEQGPLSGQKAGDKYLLGELLGEGGFGHVYKAQHLQIQRQQAIKVLLEHHFRKSEFRDRFLREAQMVAALDHPCIIHLDDFWVEPSRAYLVMPFMSRGTLQDILQKQQSFLELDRIVSYLEYICAALDYAHKQGVVHLDLKPLNLLVHEDDRLLLSDFGLAHLMKQGAIEGGSSLRFGTPHYMAPEHIQGHPERRSDLFSLGVILYQMLISRRPFEGLTPEAVMIKNITEWPLPPRSFRPELPQAVEDMLGRALAKQPEQRYQTANELLRGFKEAITASTQQQYPIRQLSELRAWMEMPRQKDSSLIACMRVEVGKEPGRVYEIRKDSLSIGRSREADIFLEDLKVSRLHASIISMGNGNYAFRDEGSAEGSQINGQSVNKYQPYPVQEGDRIQVGQTVFIFMNSRNDRIAPLAPAPRPKVSNSIGCIRVEVGKEPGRVYEISKDSLSIGRSRESDIFLEDFAVSRIHATIVNSGNGDYAFRDEGGTHGSRINGQSVSKYQPCPLQEGDRITLGQTVLIFQLRGSQICPRCGSQVAKDIKFCGVCGSPMRLSDDVLQLTEHLSVSNIQQNRSRICPLCGSQVAAGIKFCGVCGSSMPSSNL